MALDMHAELATVLQGLGADLKRPFKKFSLSLTEDVGADATEDSLGVRICQLPQNVDASSSKASAFDYAAYMSKDFVITEAGEGLTNPELIQTLDHAIPEPDFIKKLKISKTALKLMSKLQERIPDISIRINFTLLGDELRSIHIFLTRGDEKANFILNLGYPKEHAYHVVTYAASEIVINIKEKHSKCEYADETRVTQILEPAWAREPYKAPREDRVFVASVRDLFAIVEARQQVALMPPPPSAVAAGSYAVIADRFGGARALRTPEDLAAAKANFREYTASREDIVIVDERAVTEARVELAVPMSGNKDVRIQFYNPLTKVWLGDLLSRPACSIPENCVGISSDGSFNILQFLPVSNFKEIHDYRNPLNRNVLVFMGVCEYVRKITSLRTALVGDHGTANQSSAVHTKANRLNTLCLCIHEDALVDPELPGAIEALRQAINEWREPAIGPINIVIAFFNDANFQPQAVKALERTLQNIVAATAVEAASMGAAAAAAETSAEEDPERRRKCCLQ